jgi:hypothetical protein
VADCAALEMPCGGQTSPRVRILSSPLELRESPLPLPAVQQGSFDMPSQALVAARFSEFKQSIRREEVGTMGYNLSFWRP